MIESKPHNYNIERLDIISKIGADNIARALSKWTGLKITANSSMASIVHYSKLLEPAFSPDDTVAAILIRISGSIDGYLIFVFDEPSVLSIIRRILHKDIYSILDLDDLSRSVMEETGNIIGTSFLNTIAMNFSFEMFPSSPVTACDLCGAILEPMMAELAINGDYALSCRISFSSDNDEIKGVFAMLPDDINAWSFL